MAKARKRGLVNELGESKKEYVRTFMFSMKIDSPLAGLHVATKVSLVLLLSFVVIRMIDLRSLDPVGTGSLMVLSLVLLALTGVGRWLFRSYLLVIYPMLLTLFLTWLIFNPDPGERLFCKVQLYGGYVGLSLSVRLAVLVLFVLGVYLWKKTLLWGVLAGLVVGRLVDAVVQLPEWVLFHVPVYKPLALVVSDTNLIAAGTKVLGYGALVFASLMLLMSTRDIELVGAMQQLRVPYPAIFFVSVMLRSLNMALIDYGTIRQAQIARGVNLRRRGLFDKLRGLAAMSVPLIATMMRRASEVGDAAVARGMVSVRQRPTPFEETRPLKWPDWAIIAIMVVVAIVCIAFRINFSHLAGM